jgi:SMI1 / KNR4 family (SUKH-1)
MQIEFKNCNPATNIVSIHEFQLAWGINLPPCYRDFLLKHNGGSPAKNIFPITGFTDPFGGIQVFFGLGTPVKTSDLNWRVKNRIAPFPDGLLEIACTGGNDLICINTKVEDVPVYFFDHRPSWGNGIWKDEYLYVIAASFQDFLHKLKSIK